MSAILSVQNLSKQYDGGFQALKNVSLDIEEGEILALLGPNGAGKTTLISIICGLVTPRQAGTRARRRARRRRPNFRRKRAR
jgi:ABC-2 type transport system ATP-binding protein